MECHTYYKILKVDPNATYDELKANYKNLLLQYHPDKQLSTEGNQSEQLVYNEMGKNNSELIAGITQAWNCLRDPIKRKQYDTELLLQKMQNHCNVNAQITLKDMNLNRYDNKCQNVVNIDWEAKHQSDKEHLMNTSYYSYDCRCGGQYIIDESSLKEVKTEYKYNNVDDVDDQKIDDDTIIQSCTDETNSQNNRPITYNNDNNNINNKKSLTDNEVWKTNKSEVDDKMVDTLTDDHNDCNELIIECNKCSLTIILII